MAGGGWGVMMGRAPRHSSSDLASIRLKTATVARQSPFIATAPASP